MNYLLDTNLIIIYSRDSEIAEQIEARYKLFNSNNTLAISVVTLGEISALIKKLNLGKKRKAKINNILNHLVKLGLNVQELIDRYGDIDAFSQGKLQRKQGPFTSRNMGKNDLWIAATASIYNLKLLTTDKDFDHLDGEYLDLEYINIKSLKIQ